jgi:hypothetical protein
VSKVGSPWSPWIRGFLQAITVFVCAIVAQAQPALQRTNTSTIIPQGSVLPQWPKVAAFSPEPGLPAVVSQDIEVVHAKTPLGGFLIRIRNKVYGAGSGPRMIGYVAGGELRWLDLASTSLGKQNVAFDKNELRVECDCAETDGTTWQVRERFAPDAVAGSIQASMELSVDRERSIACLPMLLLFPGAGSFGSAKEQGLFAGLEYLENEPSSSEADVVGPASKREVPDSVKITFPLMVIQSGGSYLGLAWQMRRPLSAVFDSPDRLFLSGGHVMGLLFPGSNEKSREQGKLLPRLCEELHPGQAIRAHATILGGAGNSAVPAIQQFVRLRPLPELPAAPELQAYASLAAGGWLDSRIRDTNLIRHALAPGGFPSQPAADAALWMEWLADREINADLGARLHATATNVLSAVPPENLNFAGVGHIRYPAEALVFGAVAQNADHAEQAGHALLSNFGPDGSVHYHPKPGGPDYARTHSTNEASGLASRLVQDLLEDATFSGDRDLLRAGLEKLRALDKFHSGVPRGAQTWECPLHTPDILASAQMVRAYTLGFELTGEEHWLEEASYWAWSGLPFVYLVNPTEQPIGLYSTIPVFGATQWKAPVWLGLPVQWCGLVYADALYRLARYEPQGIWKKLADGITISGMQQCWPFEDPQYKGLLPDSFVLREQKRNGPAINPATVQACAAQYFGQGQVYDFRSFRTNGLLVHAPGQLTDANESRGHLSFRVQSCLKRPYFVLINGITRRPHIKVNGMITEPAAPHQFRSQRGQLILQADGPVSVELDF